MIECACTQATKDIEMERESDGRIPLQEFMALREKCPALREILIPDEILLDFQQWHMHSEDLVAHASIALLAFRRGFLPRITTPIHQYLMSSTRIVPAVAKQYLQDLREKWMLGFNPEERNRLSRIFCGRLAELQLASWLESNGHTITGLEATGAKHDIETNSNRGPGAFEIKFIGMEDDDFRMLQRSMSGNPAAYPISPYQAINYLLFRAYEAAQQLRSAGGEKTAMIVIQETGMFRFRPQIRNDWIDWSEPGFVTSDEGWNRFLSKQSRRYPHLPRDLASTVCALDSVLIFEQNHAFEFSLQKEAKPALRASMRR